jgi:holo-[acyl-carrier protein] synthase
MPLRNGVDMIEIQRFKTALNRHSDRLLNRIFTALEIHKCGADIRSLAVRFAAKEAVSKALGTGIGPVRWHDIEIDRQPSGEPVLILHGEAEILAKELGLHEWALSLSHTESLAIAFVIAAG